MAEVTTNYVKLDYYNQQHHKRWKRRVTTRIPKLICQDCRGFGGETYVSLDDGTGPWEGCGWCEETGYVDAWARGLWLRLARK